MDIQIYIDSKEQEVQAMCSRRGREDVTAVLVISWQADRH